MGDIYSLADKLERAMQRGTGFQVSASEMLVMVHEDVVDAIFAAKLRRLKNDFGGAEGAIPAPDTSSSP